MRGKIMDDAAAGLEYHDRPDFGVTYVARRGADGTVTVTAESR